MIKKLSLGLVFVFFTINVFSQTIVSTNPENKNVVLEEYTGIHCVWCPSGHVIAQAILDANPDDVSLINIHVGGYATPGSGEPDFRTPFGPAIASEAGVAFYPSGSVGRHVFSGSATAMSRGEWTSAANTTLGQASYVNVGVEADINVQTNEMTIHVEAYYTGDSPASTNLLNVALLQNNTLGPQTGGNMGNNYNHMHRLVHMVTGQWGISIPTTTTGTLVDETFTYTIPADYNGVPTELINMEVVAFVTETHQELPSGKSAHPTFSGVTEANDAYLRYVENIDIDCQTSIIPHINIQNLGQDEITSLAIEYTVNSGTTEVYNWTGSILTLHNETIALPEISDIDTTNTIEISLPDDNNNSNNSVNANFDGFPEHSGHLTLIINTDSNGEECTWNITTISGSVLTSGGPYDSNTTIEKQINISTGCYIFNLYDSNGNGGNTVNLSDSLGTVIYETSGNYGSGESQQFAADNTLGTGDVNERSSIVIYPNPANSVLNINNAENSSIQIYDLAGRVVLSKTNISMNEQLEVSGLTTGTYLIKIIKGNKVITDKFIVNR